ncbi:MAG TPA: hypothetical protein VFM18_23625 [Methanosarcina sp.]|nr:hypothetical protein [Methanosarcina sp.]
MITFILTSLYALWVLFIFTMGIYRAFLAKRLSTSAKILGAPFVLLAAIVDILCNMTAATILFAELPRELYVTRRLTRYMKDGKGWRYDIAKAICLSLLDPFDPTGKHCA